MFNIIVAIYKRNKTIAKRAFPWTLIISRLIGGFFTIIFPYAVYTFFLKGALSERFNQYSNQSDYITYIVLGSMFFILGISTMMEIGRALITELREGTLEPFLLSSASKIGYYIGCLAEQLGRSIFQVSVVLIFGIILGARIIGIFSFQSITVIALAIFGFFSMSLTLSCIMLYSRDTYITQNTLFTLMSFISGVSFPVEYLPTWLQYISHLLPITASLKLFRLVVISNQSIILHLDLVLELLMLSGMYILIGVLWFKKLERKLIENIFG